MRPVKGREASTGGRYKGKWKITDARWGLLADLGEIDFHPQKELFYLSEKILDWYYNNEMGVVIIHGQTGYGKSVYGCTSCAEVYGHKQDNDTFPHDWEQEDGTFYYDWDAVRRNIVFTPRQFVKLCRTKKEPDRMLLWDDAGYHLNSLEFNHPLVRKIGKFMEVGRSKFSSIVFTCSDLRQILGKIRNIPHVNTIKIIKGQTPSKVSSDFKWKKDRRLAKIHSSWVSEDLKKSGRKREYYDVFYAHLPGVFDTKKNQKSGFYGWYKPFRDGFCEIAIDEIDEVLAKMDEQSK